MIFPTMKPMDEYATAADYEAAVKIAAKYGEVVPPSYFDDDGTIDGIDPIDWADSVLRSEHA